MKIHFQKMHGIGNDFVLIDLTNQSVSLSTEQIKLLADRNLGIGCDQVLLIQPCQDQSADYLYTIYNGNGSEAEQCGNGARCVAKYLFDNGIKNDVISLKTKTSLIHCQQEGKNIRVDMGIPDLNVHDVILPIEKIPLELHTVSIGNPHAVYRVDNVDTIAVEKVGKELSVHAEFPKGINVEFMQIINPENIALRVYERGAGETLSCGSGACAAVIVGRLKYELKPKVTVTLRGGTLQVEWQERNQPLILTGPATHVFEGTITL